MKQADRWRVVTVALALLALVPVVWAVVSTVSGDPGVLSAITKLGAGVVLGGVASYCARQSSRHRMREEEARGLEMDLVAFGPFIEDLPVEARQEARTALVAKIFGRSYAQSDSSQPSISSEHVSVLGQLADILARGSTGR